MGGGDRTRSSAIQASVMLGFGFAPLARFDGGQTGFQGGRGKTSTLAHRRIRQALASRLGFKRP